MSDVDDRIDLGNALRILGPIPGKTPPMACCPRDGEPLVSTFEFRGAEFVCVVCEGKFGFLSPRARASTPELEARHTELQAIYDEARAARRPAQD